MNDQTNMAQLRYLEELKISLVHAGFEPERIEDQHLPVCWEKGRLCQISGRGSVLYRQENVDGIGAQDALQSVIHIAAMTAEYMTAMGRAPKLQATGLEGDYRILADFGGTVLAGTPSKHGVQFVTWNWDYGTIFQRNRKQPPRRKENCRNHRGWSDFHRAENQRRGLQRGPLRAAPCLCGAGLCRAASARDGRLYPQGKIHRKAPVLSRRIIFAHGRQAKTRLFIPVFCHPTAHIVHK